MSTVLIVVVLMLLSFGAGLLVGTSWTVHVVERQYRRLAAERRALHEWRRTLQETAWRQRAPSRAVADARADANVPYGP
ncbi:hypothetical protein [Pseudonocardia acaciae]|uniref:hypothetical protein n=1 Tax=Pseudonocardia acaciae TaxID=551276 RepID=UPI00048F7C6A|nr:hypothetical protein [Pseudonocardia acaciae]